jgi:hypothetical protein
MPGDINMTPDAIQKTIDDLLEQLATIEHERWSHWQRYMHSKCIAQGADGSLLIPADLVQRWERQASTPYASLTEREKESDREQVRKYLPLIAQAFRRPAKRAGTSRGGSRSSSARSRKPMRAGASRGGLRGGKRPKIS